MQKTHQPTHVRKILLGLISLAVIFALMFGGSGAQAVRAQTGGGKTESFIHGWSADPASLSLL